MKKKMIVSVVLVIIIILATIMAVICHNTLNRGTLTNRGTVEGYVRQVYLDDGRILICNDIKNVRLEGYIGDCYITIDENTVISDGRALDSIKQGEHILVTYTGTLAEICPSEIDGTVELLQFVK